MSAGHAQYVNSQSPLLGVVLCCTSVAPEERVNLANVAKQMGAVHKLDLTSDVTHLIVGNIETPKYKYVAKERPDVKVILAEWVEAVRDSWMQGGDTNVAVLEEEYRVPTFFGLRICLTGFEDITQRQAITQSVSQHGAAYHGDLSKSVTHLVAAVPQGKKYEFARQWGINVVTLQWITDSLRRRMALEGPYYDPLLPTERQGQGAFKEFLPEHVQLEKRARDEEAAQKASEMGRKKLRRTASAKLGSQNFELLQNITAGSDHTQGNVSNNWMDLDSTVDAARWNETALPERQNGNSIAEKPRLSTSDAEKSDDRPKQGIFQGRLIYIYGFDSTKTTVLFTHLKANGAAACTSEANLSSATEVEVAEGILLVPHNMPNERLTNISSVAGSMTKATEWWAERCLHQRRFIPPKSNVLCQPFSNFGIKDFHNLQVCSTAFSGVELLQLSKVVKLMGATYDEFLKPSISVLISNTKAPNAAKLRFATEHGIPVVSPEWLWRCIETARKVPYGNFLLHDCTSREVRPVTGGDGGRNGDVSAVPNEAKQQKSLVDIEAHRGLENLHHLNKSHPSKQRSVHGTESSPLTSEEEKEDEKDEEDEDEEHSMADTLTNRSRPAANNSMNNSEPQRSGSLLLLERNSMNAKVPSQPLNSNPQKNVSSSRLAKINQATTEDLNSPINGKENPLLTDTNNVQDLNASIAELLALKRSNTNKKNDNVNDKEDSFNNNGRNPTDSLNKPLSTSRNTKERRRRGLLGRATSNISNPSNASRASSNELGRTAAAEAAEAAPNTVDLSPGRDTTTTTLTAAAAAAAAAGARNASFPDIGEGDMPSQALLYEGPEVQQQREAVIRKIGGRIEVDSERSRTVQGIGVVKDLAAEVEGSNGMADAVGLRVKRRSRQAERDFRDLR